MASLPNFIKHGAAGLDQLQGSKFLKLESGKTISIIPLTGVEPPQGEVNNGRNCVISYNQFTMWLDNLPDGVMSPMFPAIGGAGDPGTMLGLEPRFRAMMLCLVKGEEEERILALGISLFKQLIEIEQADGESIRGKVLKISKTGEGLKTKYRVVPTSARVDFDGEPETNLADHLGPTTREAIIEMLVRAEVWPPEGGDPYATPKKSKPGISTSTPSSGSKKSKPTPPPVVDEDEDEDFEDDEEEEVVTPPAKKKAPVAPPKPAAKEAAKPAKGKVKPPVEEVEEDEEDDWDDEDFED